MMRRSGARPVVKRSKLSREMLRRAASGHIEATQLLKLAAACRIALAVIRGWPEAPSSPLQGIEPEGIEPEGIEVAGGAGCPAVASDFFWPEKMPPNRFDSPPPEDWAEAGPANRVAAINAAKSRFADGSKRGVMSYPLPDNSGFQEACSRFPIH